jgi:hypothetical protein
MAEIRQASGHAVITRRVIDPGDGDGQGGHTGSAKTWIRVLTSIDDLIGG